MQYKTLILISISVLLLILMIYFLITALKVGLIITFVILLIIGLGMFWRKLTPKRVQPTKNIKPKHLNLIDDWKQSVSQPSSPKQQQNLPHPIKAMGIEKKRKQTFFDINDRIEATKYALCVLYAFKQNNNDFLKIQIGVDFWKRAPIKRIWKETVVSLLLDFNVSSNTLDQQLVPVQERITKKLNTQNIPLISVDTFRLVLQKLVVIWLMGIEDIPQEQIQDFVQAFGTNSRHFASIPQYSTFLQEKKFKNPVKLPHDHLAKIFCTVINTDEECLIAQDFVKDPEIIVDSGKRFVDMNVVIIQ